MNPLYYTERHVEIDGWEVNLTTYQLDGKWHSKADNVSPGAALARVVADTREEAEQRALTRARELLSRTKRHPV
jgi:hypothetical protein